MTRRIHLGLSTCPNDTFLAHALLTGALETPGLEFEIELLDVQALNERLVAGDFDVAKASYHIALERGAELVALSVGSALGFGNGPLLLARPGTSPQATPGKGDRILAPGANTTATLLYRLFHAEGAEPEHVVFSEIMPALGRGEADYGVCIHEGRFTYEDTGLVLIEDLGAAWEGATNVPLPLGGLFARRSLDEETLDRVAQALRSSLEAADEDPDAALPTMREHAQELDDEVIQAHVELYVNGWTRRLGPQGERAIAELARRAHSVGLLPRGAEPLRVFEPYGTRRVFHIVPDAGRDDVARHGELKPPSLASEGFVHLSFVDQLEGTLDAHFGGSDVALVMELDPRELADDVRFEVSRGGERFPHLYRPLDLGEDVLERWELRRAASGRFELPPAVAWSLPSWSAPDFGAPPERTA
ncbi:MAG: MqnA/MqnD/SBP family protein [Planctomycetota bacterium]